MPYGIICCTYHQLKYSSSNRWKKTPKKTRATQKSLPFVKWRFKEKIGQENGPKEKNDKTERAKGLGGRTREDI